MAFSTRKNVWRCQYRHSCRVNEATNQNEENLVENVSQSKWRILIDGFVSCCTISSQRVLTKHYLQSETAIRNERRRHLKWFPWTIHPFSLFRMYWETSMIFVYLLLFALNPMVTAYGFQLPDLIQRDFMLLIFSGAFALDMIVNFFTGFYHHTTKIVELRRAMIVRRYLTTYFIFDLTSVLPWYTISFDPNDHWIDFSKAHNHWKVIMRVVPLVRIVRIRTLFNYMNEFSKEWKIAPVSFVIWRLIVIAVVLIHWVSCLSYYVSFASLALTGDLNPSDLSTEIVWDRSLAGSFNLDGGKFRSLLTMQSAFLPFTRGQTSQMSNGTTLEHHFRAWVVSFVNLSETSQWTLHQLYLYSMCQSILLTTLSSYSEFNLRVTADIVFSLFATMISLLIFIYFLVQIYFNMQIVTSAQFKYEEMVWQLREYMAEKRLPLPLQNRLLCYYEYRFQRNYFNEQQILYTLTGQLEQEVTLHRFRHLVESVPFLKHLPWTMLVRIATRLHSEVFLTNDVILKVNTIGHCMYFIAAGTVAVYTSTGKEICHLEDGNYFGEVALISEDRKRIASVVAVETCELFRLDRDDFMRIIEPEPDLITQLEKIAVERTEKTINIDEHNRIMLAQRKLRMSVFFP